RVFDRSGDLQQEHRRIARWHGSLGQLLCKAPSIDERHRKEMLALVLANLEDRYDPRMVEMRGGLGLGVEPFDIILIGELPGQDHLESTRAVQADLAGSEHHAHAAAGQLAVDLVIAKVADAAAG